MINEVFPEIVLRRKKSDLHKRPRLRPLRFANQTHVPFPDQPVALALMADNKTKLIAFGPPQATKGQHIDD